MGTSQGSRHLYARGRNTGNGSGTNIGDAAELFATTVRAIRFYEEKHLIETRRSNRNNRVIDPYNIDRLRSIFKLKACGFSIFDITDIFQASGQASDPVPGDAKLFARLEDIEAEFERLDSEVAALQHLFHECGKRWPVRRSGLERSNRRPGQRDRLKTQEVLAQAADLPPLEQTAPG